MKRYCFHLIIAALLMGGGLWMRPDSCSAQDSDDGFWDSQMASPLMQELKQGFDFNFKILTFGVFQELADSSQNPGNTFYRLTKRRTEVNFRPDLFWVFKKVEFSVKPRFDIETHFSNSDHTNSSDNETQDTFFINEWRTRFSLTDTLFLSIGRENLQWGPSWLTSPSNPFFTENGRDMPRMEVKGMDFSRVVFTPTMEWTLSAIANYDKGEAQFTNYPFEKGFALKVDYTGAENYAGTIISYREHDRPKVSFFGGRTLTDALLVYAEGVVSQGTDALYPVEQPVNPLGYTMLPSKENDSDLYTMLLAGSSYTTEWGPTLSLEYIYNSYGYDNDEARDYYTFRDSASELFTNGGILKGLGASGLAAADDTGLKLLRQNYLMAQYQHNDIQDVLNLTFRATCNMDDSSWQYYGNADYYFGDHIQFFLTLVFNDGKNNSEFTKAIDYQWIIGMEYTF